MLVLYQRSDPGKVFKGWEKAGLESGALRPWPSPAGAAFSLTPHGTLEMPVTFQDGPTPSLGSKACPLRASLKGWTLLGSSSPQLGGGWLPVAPSQSWEEEFKDPSAHQPVQVTRGCWTEQRQRVLEPQIRDCVSPTTHPCPPVGWSQVLTCCLCLERGLSALNLHIRGDGERRVVTATYRRPAGAAEPGLLAARGASPFPRPARSADHLRRARCRSREVRPRGPGSVPPSPVCPAESFLLGGWGAACLGRSRHADPRVSLSVCPQDTHPAMGRRGRWSGTSSLCP